MTSFRYHSFVLAVLVTIKPALALTAAFRDPGCLAGYSPEGLPYLAPSIACLALLGVGWRLWASSALLWQLVSWASLLGASAFATTPLALSLGWHWLAWEIYPLVAVSIALLGSSYAALSSRWGRYRLLGATLPVALALTVIAPWVPSVAHRWPSMLIVSAYGTLALVLAVIAYTYKTE